MTRSISNTGPAQLVSTTVEALQQTRENFLQTETLVLNACDIFEEFYTSDLNANLMRSVSKMCADALKATDANREQVNRHLNDLIQQLRDAGKTVEQLK